MGKEKRIIIVGLTVGTGKEIAKALGCCTKMVSLAVQGRKRTPLAKKIRNVAIQQYGGVEVEVSK